MSESTTQAALHAGGIEAVPFDRMARCVNTPFYAYSTQQLRSQLARLRRHLPSAFDIYYSLKANPTLALVGLLAAEGAGSEVCSPTELATALAAGVAPQRILYVGPGKTPAALARCVEAGIKAIVAESVEELEIVNALAEAAGRVQTVALRINPDFGSEQARLVMSGKATQFGMDTAQAHAALAQRHRWPGLAVKGLHVYMGSRILSAQAVAANTRNILQLALALRDRHRLELDFVDVGGGLGVPYFAKEQPLDVPRLGRDLVPSVAEFRRRAPATQLIMELGRYLVAEAGIFVTRVQYLKTNGGTLFAICDGGSNCHGAAAGLNSLLRKNFPVWRLGDNHARPQRRYQVAGPLCTPADLLGDNLLLPQLDVHDLIGIPLSGAYGLTASPGQFLGFGEPAELLIDGARLSLIRRPEAPEQLLARQQAIALEEEAP